MRSTPLLSILAALLFSGCGEQDKLTYQVSCDACRIRYSIGDSVNTVHVRQEWHSSVRVNDGQLYGLHVDSITGINAATAFISLGGDMQYVDVCTDNATCDMNYIGQAKLPWWGR